MRRGRAPGRAAAWFLAAVLCWGLAGPAALAAGSEARTVRVPCGINDLLYLDEAGQPTGRYEPYLSKLAAVNGWRLEYVETNWNGAMELLESGGLDLLFPTNYDPRREATMDFSTLVGGYTAPGLFARADSGYDYGDFSSFDGARIAVTRGSSNEQALIDFAADRGFSYEPVYIEDNDEKVEALGRGDVDMVILTVYNDLNNTVLVSVMDAQPFYFTVQKGNDDLLRELDQGMQQLVRDNPELMAETFRQCLLGGTGGMLAFTREERAFLESGRPVTVGFYEDAKPLAYQNDKGEWDGIYLSLLEYVKEASGLDLTPCPVKPGQDWRELMARGELDFFLGESTSLAAWDPAYDSTDAFFPYDNVLITRSDCVFGELEAPTVALASGRVYLNGFVPESLGAGEIKLYPSARECLLAVSRGEADGAVMNSVEFNYQSKNPRFSGLILWESYRMNTEGGLMCSVDLDPVIFSTTEKALSLLSDDFVSTTINDDLNVPYDATVADGFYMLRYPLAVFAAVVVAAVAAWAVIRRARRRQRDILAQVQEHERHQLRILAALSRNYDAIYYTNLDTGLCEEIQIGDQATQGAGRLASGPCPHADAMREYVKRYVQPEYYTVMLTLCEPQDILLRFQERGDFSVRYQVKPNDQGQEYFEIHLVDVSERDKEHAMVFGTRCIDDAVRAEADQRQLLQNALAEAEQASAAKSDFLSKMSHDIRTPMNAIIGMTAIAGAHLDDTQRVRDALGKIASSSRYLLGLINEVLDMSKIESRTITLNEEPFNLSELLSNMLIMVQPQIKQHGHKLDVHIQDIQHEDVLGDSLRIQQAFVNIMDNAVKYTPDGGQISLSVRELPVRTPRLAQYEFTFRDNGIGMSQAYLQSIFEPFSRAEDLRVSKIQGTGLGMAITQNIVQQMNGSIKVESQEGKGSTFRVTIFLKLQDVREMDASELAGLPVLVVDDDPDARESVCDLLEQIGMESTGCESGQEAVAEVERALAQEKPFYAAILDWKMPGMDGLETAKAIRRLVGDQLPVIILSAYDWSDIEPEARAAGVDAFLSKPVFKSGLIRQFQLLKNAKEGGEKEAESVHDQLQAIQGSDYTGARVLLVEDNDLNREIAREIMEMAGLQVEEAENGREAVDKVLASAPGYYRMIFMDIQMPVMSGYDAAMAIRGLGRSDSLSVPIIAMTANAFVEDIQASKAAGMNEHLAKPIDFDKFNAILQKYLG